MEAFELTQGDSPLILAMPHTGTYVPKNILQKLNDSGKALRDTDWHIDKLYQGLVEDATVVRALFHRYVIDANRAPGGESLYPGQNTTGLCPTTDFDGKSIYQSGQEPGEMETAQRCAEFHTPYHQAIGREIERIHNRHGVVVLYDCHSIRSVIPYLFEGILPDFNIGTNSGKTCARSLETLVADICSNAEGFSSVLNGRFKGGWTTRHYGDPGNNIHVIQMELAQATHLKKEELPFDYSPQIAARIRPHLKSILEALTSQALKLSQKG